MATANPPAADKIVVAERVETVKEVVGNDEYAVSTVRFLFVIEAALLAMIVGLELL